MMAGPDFNLLIALDALLTHGSVAKAAKRLQLSPSAMSRTLARLRAATGDPLLVRAGRGLVPTPRALVLREKVRLIVEDGRAILLPEKAPDLRHVERSFALRTREGFVENFGIDLINRVRKDAPQIKLHFVEKPDKDSTALREGAADLEVGVIGDETSPEVRVQALFEDTFIGVVRANHPLTQSKITLPRYLAGEHVQVARRSNVRGPVEKALQEDGRELQVLTVVGNFTTALALAQNSDLIATVPERFTGTLRADMFSFPLPLRTPGFTVSLMWHPRLDADPAHRWLRGCIRDVCRPADTF